MRMGFMHGERTESTACRGIRLNDKCSEVVDVTWRDADDDADDDLSPYDDIHTAG